MTIRHLKVFIKVCECNYSITRASEELMVAQPSVSQTIIEIEDYYGIALFNRVNRKLILTKEGKILLAKAKDVVSEFEEFELLANKNDLNPEIRVGATMTFASFVIPQYLNLLKNIIPNVDPHIYVDKPKGLEEKILLGDLDFGFEEGLIKDKTIKSVCIGEDELIAVSAIDFKASDQMKLEELIKYPLLLREEGNPSRRILDYQLAIKGIKIRSPKLESISNNAILSLTMAGEGIGILPRAIARRWLQNGSIRQITLDIPLKRKLFLISHKNKKMNPYVKKAYSLANNILNLIKR